MSSTNKTTYYELSQYVGTDKPTYLSDYNGDMLKIDTGIHDAADDASTALTTANSAASVAADAATAASTATTTANSANTTALEAKTTAETAATNAAAALAAAADAEEAAEANTIENLAPAYDPTLTYDVDDLVTYIDAQGSGKLYKCIIAVETPEAFNINKWDDITTSEVYDKKAEVVATVTSDGVKTYAELIAPILEAVINDDDKYRYIMSENDGAQTSYTDIISATLASYTGTRVVRITSIGHTLTGTRYKNTDVLYQLVGSTVTVTAKESSTDIGDTTASVSVTDFSNTIVSAGRTIKLYRFNN